MVLLWFNQVEGLFNVSLKDDVSVRRRTLKERRGKPARPPLAPIGGSPASVPAYCRQLSFWSSSWDLTLRCERNSSRPAQYEIFVGILFGLGMKNYILLIDFDEAEGFESFRNPVDISQKQRYQFVVVDVAG